MVISYCHFSKCCLQNIETWLKIDFLSLNLQQLIRWISYVKVSKFKKQAWVATLSVEIYCICQSRNKAYWEQQVPTIGTIIQKLKQLIRGRILVVLPNKLSRRDCIWFNSLRALLLSFGLGGPT